MTYHANTTHKKVIVAILISVNFKIIDTTNDKKGNFKNRVNQDDIVILNKYAHNNI